MTKYFRFLIAIFCSFFVSNIAAAQEFKATNYYYNNFNNGRLGSAFTQIGSSAVLELTPTATTNNLGIGQGYALQSIGNGLSGGLQTSFFTNADLSTEQYGNEWTLIYKNTGGNTDDSDVITNGENAWKYWLFSSSTNLNALKGYYLTQIGNTLHLKYYIDQYNKGTLIKVDIANNTTYAIRIQRLKRDGGKWVMFLDQYTEAKQEATTEVGKAAWDGRETNYATGALLCSATTDGRFKFDEIKAYSIQLQIAGANDSAFGISNPIYPGQQNAVIYGLKVNLRGLMDITQLSLSLTGTDITQIFTGNMYLRRSTDSYFGNADDVTVATLNYYQGAIQNYKLAEKFNSVGTAEGDMVAAAYFYITANVKANPSNGGFSFSGAPTLYSGDFNVNYADAGTTVVDVKTDPSSSGKLKDWTGAVSTDWFNVNNWSPVGVPTNVDLVRIGVVSYTNQPLYNGTTTVGNMLFGTQKNVVLTTTGILNVANNVEVNGNLILAGEGRLNLTGSFIAKPTIAQTLSVNLNELALGNFILNTENATSNLSVLGSKVVVQNIISGLGNNLSQFALQTGGQLVLKAKNPFATTTNNNFNFTSGTVSYSSDNLQNVSAAFNYGNIVFDGAGTKTVDAGSLNVFGNWTSGIGMVDFLSKDNTVNFKGTTQNITDLGSNNGKGLLFKKVVFSGGNIKTLVSGKFAVAPEGSLSMGANTRLISNSNLTFCADQTGFAALDVVPSTSSIEGQVVVERFIKGGSKEMWRTYRMLSSPVYDNTTTFINDASAERTYSFTQFIDDMIVTGKGGAANGFDQTSGNSASAWVYNNGFSAIPNINTNVKIGSGSYLFYRGDRSNFAAKVVNPFVDAESISMTYKGILNQQDVVVPLVHGSTGYSLVGNPYAAAIDWNKVVKSANVTAILRIWNPSNRQYAVYNGIDGINGGSKYISPGQSFFVQTSDNNSPQILFKESAKVPLQSSIQTPFVQSNIEKVRGAKVLTTDANETTAAAPAKISIKLAKNNTENSDETLLVMMENGVANYADFDVLREGGEGVFLSSKSADGKDLAINYMPAVPNVANVLLSVDAASNGDYSLSFSMANIPAGYLVKLNDTYLNTTVILTSGSVYPISINKNIANSFGANRFQVVLERVTTLPVVLNNFTGRKTNLGIELNWKTTSEVNNSYFLIERAGADGNYVQIAKVSSNGVGAYAALDKNPNIGINYYRLKQVDKNGDAKIFDPIAVKYELAKDVNEYFVAYPTMFKDEFTVKGNDTLSGDNFIVKVTDVTGKLVFNKTVSKSILQSGFKVNAANNTFGVYFVSVLATDGSEVLFTSKMIKK